MKKITFLHLTFAFLSTPLLAQQSKLTYEVEAQAIGTTNDVVPFWMRSNQFGSVPSNGGSGSFIGRGSKDYDRVETGIFDWGVSFEGRANIGKNSKALLIEGYAKVKLGMIQLKAGRSKDVMGLNYNQSLSSGNFAISGNALGIPKVELSIPDYYTIPIFDGIFAFKGTFSHGWLGNKRIADTIAHFDRNPVTSNVTNAKTYFHQKSFYGRFGKQDWKLNLFAGFNHNVFWGSERDIYGEDYELSTLNTLYHVLTGKAYGNGARVPRSKLGNQLGSIDVGMEYKFKDIIISLYRQNIYDVGALAKLANIRDGLNGISVENRNVNKRVRKTDWSKITFELLSTKHQAGVFGSKKTNSGDEDYYNNYFYPQGWSYLNMGLGTPLISPKYTTRDGLPSHPSDYFINNRVVAFHLGMEGFVSDWKLIFKSTISNNYGTFGTSEEGHSTGNIGISPPNYGLFGKKKQFSGYISANKPLQSNYSLGFDFALDKGALLRNSFGTMVKLSKRFN